MDHNDDLHACVLFLPPLHEARWPLTGGALLCDDGVNLESSWIHDGVGQKYDDRADVTVVIDKRIPAVSCTHDDLGKLAGRRTRRWLLSPPQFCARTLRKTALFLEESLKIVPHALYDPYGPSRSVGNACTNIFFGFF